MLTTIKTYPSQQTIKEYFTYCAQTGNLIWKKKPGPKINIGSVAGYRTNAGYIRVELQDEAYMVHRLIYIYHHGDIPHGYVVDHIDGYKSHNFIDNLRLATSSNNAHNRKTPSNSSTGQKGVYWETDRNKWTAKVTVDGRMKRIGRYKTFEEAVAAYQNNLANYVGEFARTA